MASAALRNPENDGQQAVRLAVGRAIERAYQSLGWTLDQLAGELDRDPRQVRRWMDGAENAQLHVLFSVVVLRGPLVVELARLCEDVAVRTVIELRRSA